MTVNRSDLEALIERVRADTKDPRAGIYGPGSVAWQIDKEAALFLGGGKAALMQLAHPFVAHAVDQHSQTRSDPLGRFQRTFDNVFAMVFGDLEGALKSARRVHNIHSRIVGEIREDVGAFAKGSRYEANDEAALLWVHATLIETAVQMYELVVRPLSYEEKNQYWQESAQFARLFGIPDSVLPSTWREFLDYYDDMVASDVISVGEPAREIGKFLFASPRTSFKPLFGWVQVMTAGLLPPRLRGEFGLRWSRADAAAFRASVAALRRVYPRLPPRLRYSPAYVAARRRLAGKTGPDRVGQMIERVALLALESKKTGRAAA